MKKKMTPETKKTARTLMFNGQFLLDSSSYSGHYAEFEGAPCRYFDSRAALLEEMEKISQANDAMGNGAIFDCGKILDYDELISAVEEAAAGELVLIETLYQTVGNLDDYEKFCGLIRKSPGLVMVGFYDKFTPNHFPVLIW